MLYRSRQKALGQSPVHPRQGYGSAAGDIGMYSASVYVTTNGYGDSNFPVCFSGDGNIIDIVPAGGTNLPPGDYSADLDVTQSLYNVSSQTTTSVNIDITPPAAQINTGATIRGRRRYGGRRYGVAPSFRGATLRGRTWFSFAQHYDTTDAWSARPTPI